MIGRVAICLIFAVGAVGGASAFSSPVAPRSWVRMASPSRMVAVSSSSALDDWLAEAPAAPKPADKEQADSQDGELLPALLFRETTAVTLAHHPATLPTHHLTTTAITAISPRAVFEKLFELADVDASGGIDVDEFKQFYRLLSVVAGEASTTDATALDARLADGELAALSRCVVLQPATTTQPATQTPSHPATQPPSHPSQLPSRTPH